jgi:hypothetical protein
MRSLAKLAGLLLLLGGCSTHYVEVQRTVSNDPAFTKARVVVVEVVSDPVHFAELSVSPGSGRVSRSGQLSLDTEVLSAALAESLSFSGKSVLTKAEYEKIRIGLQALRPSSGFRLPQVDALIRLHLQVGLQSGLYEQERVFAFYRRARRCRYLKDPPPKYQPCQETENSTWEEIRVASGASGWASVGYSGEVFLNEADEFRLHRSLSGGGVIPTAYEDERAMAQKVANGLGRLISNEMGTLTLKLRLEIDEGNHSDAIDLLKEGKLEEARRFLEQEVEDPLFESSTDYYNLGLIYHAYGDRVVAAEYYGKAIAAGGYKRVYVDALRNLRTLDAETTLD